MKSTILNLKERVLVVEYDTVAHAKAEFFASKAFPNEYKDKNAICWGPKLTEEIASKYVENFCADMSIPAYRNYAVKPEDLEDDHWAHVANDALDSFISAIEVNGYYWKDNPVVKPAKNDLNGSFFTMQKNFHQEKAFYEAESKTFHPDRTLIFEIL